jgi:DNA processing protein
MAERGLTITSGLAAGIDEAGHRGAVATVGGTVAVLGCGIDVVFPRSNARLALDIAARGVLVSEYPPGVPPNPWQFPARNRIIAGLSLGVLVVEAGGRSGALITAKAALESGREVFAIPGSIHNPLSRGCHRLIRQGAKLVEEAADVLVELQPLLELELEAPPGAVGPPGRADGDSSVPPGAAEGSPAGRDPAYARLLEALEYEPAGMAELASRSGLTTAELSSMLLILELEGFVEALPGGRYCRLPARSR